MTGRRVSASMLVSVGSRLLRPMTSLFPSISTVHSTQSSELRRGLWIPNAPRTTESLPAVSPPRACRAPHIGAVDLSASVLPNSLHHFRLVSAISPGLQYFITSHPEKSLLHLPCPSFHVEISE